MNWLSNHVGIAPAQLGFVLSSARLVRDGGMLGVQAAVFGRGVSVGAGFDNGAA
ncbi:hypothetical protein P8H27_03705 [Pseudomonas sp. sp1636]|uniref:hypothetical protein n=1 Tax=Pseudomonas sp. sp1636 TaxID=3036707 RepID=UPI0025A52C84|nr:hypothetical protein [Pseudomonas sp. sp1636]MDM8347996.1 hypothetical protein [Pseudomonas sp. sp1636]